MDPNMTPEAKAAVMNLMGTTYGQMKKHDDMIVGASGNLSPAAQQMQAAVKNLAQVPTISQEQYRAQQAGHPMPAPPAPQAAPTAPEPAPAPTSTSNGYTRTSTSRTTSTYNTTIRG
jgi:hypothetical protein